MAVFFSARVKAYPPFLFTVDIDSTMPRISYETTTFQLNSALNLQTPESMSTSMNTFALDSATRQPRRRAESMPWNHQTSTLRFHRNSLQLRPLPKALPVPHFVQAERDRDAEMVWENGLGDVEREGGHDSYHTT